MKDILSLPHVVTVNVFLMLDGKSLHNARLVNKSWNKYIVRNIWKFEYARNVLERRLELNWSVKNLFYKSFEFEYKCEVPNPYILEATDNYIIFQNCENLNEIHQQIHIFDRKACNIWKTDHFGPVKIVPVLQKQNYIGTKFKINEEVFSICFESKDWFPIYYVLKVFSTKSKKLLYEENVENFCDLHFHGNLSTFYIIQSEQIKLLAFENENIKNHKVFVNNVTLKPFGGGSTSSNFNHPYILYWQNLEGNVWETEMFVWKIDNNKDNVSCEYYSNEFKSKAEIRRRDYNEYERYTLTEIIRDVQYVDSFFILLIQERMIDDFELGQLLIY